MYFFFSEKSIISACLNTAQSLVTEINSQNEHFITLTKRLVEVRENSSNESFLCGIIETCFILFDFFIYMGVVSDNLNDTSSEISSVSSYRSSRYSYNILNFSNSLYLVINL